MERLIEGLRPDDGREAIRVVAGILIGVGMLIMGLRRDSPFLFGEETSEFEIFLILVIPTLFLYGAGLLGRRLSGVDRRWQALFTVFGMLIAPFALFQLASVVDDGYDATWVAFVVFTTCAVACVLAWAVAQVRFQLLLAALYGAFAWLALLDKLLSDGLESDLDAIRALLLVFAGALVFAAVLVRRHATREPDASFGELLTGAGLAALIAYSLAPIAVLEAIDSGIIPAGDTSTLEIGQDAIWDVLTLLTGIVLVVFGVGQGLRGQVYVGAFMLVIFILSVGFDLDDPSPEGAIVGWPLLLVLAGAGLFAFSLLPRDTGPDTDRLGDFYDGGELEPGSGFGRGAHPHGTHPAAATPTAQPAPVAPQPPPAAPEPSAAPQQPPPAAPQPPATPPPGATPPGSGSVPPPSTPPPSG